MSSGSTRCQHLRLRGVADWPDSAYSQANGGSAAVLHSWNHHTLTGQQLSYGRGSAGACQRR